MTTSPRRRPPLALRVFVALVAVMVVLANAAIMLSDRAPDVLRLFGFRLIERLSERVDTGGRAAEVASDPRLPESYALVHIGVWAVGAALVALAIWTWRGLIVSAVGVFALSVLVELGQARWTHTRVSQLADIRANALGVMLGTAFVALCYLAWSGVAALFNPGRSRSGRFGP